VPITSINNVRAWSKVDKFIEAFKRTWGENSQA